MSLFAGDMILYIESPKNTIGKLAEHINELVNLQDTKCIHRNLLHSYILTMNYQKEKSRKQLHLPLQPKE